MRLEVTEVEVETEGAVEKRVDLVVIEILEVDMKVVVMEGVGGMVMEVVMMEVRQKRN